MSAKGAGGTVSRVAYLDGLRAISALGILVLHAYPVQTFWMWNFVELFFLLSGYLITSILLRSDLSQPLVLRNFWARRILRIWPVYYLSLLSAFGVWALHGWLGMGWPHYNWTRSMFFVQFAEGYLHGPNTNVFIYAPWFRHSWTLAAEEQFYVLWPLTLLLLRKKRLRVITTCLLLLGVAATLRSLHYPLVLLFTRCDGLVLGGLLAALRHGNISGTTAITPRWPFVLATVAGLPPVLFYLYQGYFSGAMKDYNDIATIGNWTLNCTGFALLDFALVGALLNQSLPRTARLLSWSPLVYVGNVSFALYMFQGPVRDLLYLAFGTPNVQMPLLDLATIPATLAVSEISRRFIEGPCDQYKGHFPVHLKPAKPATEPAGQTAG